MDVYIDVSSMVYRISLESKVHYFRLLFWSRKLETRARDANIHIADRNQPRLSRKWRREGKGRRIIKVVDSSFRFTRVVRFASATSQFFFVPREPMVSRSTISTRPVIPGIRAHVYIPLPQIDKTLMEAI